MHTVNDNSETDLDKQRAIDELEWSLRVLAANLMRVARGAGKPYEIEVHTVRLLKALIAYQDTTGSSASEHLLKAALSLDMSQDLRERLSAETLELEYAKQSIVDGCLQVAASTLLCQATQRQAGSSQMHQGMRDLAEARDRLNNMPTQRTVSRQKGYFRARKAPKDKG